MSGIPNAVPSPKGEMSPKRSMRFVDSFRSEKSLHTVGSDLTGLGLAIETVSEEDHAEAALLQRGPVESASRESKNSPTKDSERRVSDLFGEPSPTAHTPRASMPTRRPSPPSSNNGVAMRHSVATASRSHLPHFAPLTEDNLHNFTLQLEKTQRDRSYVEESFVKTAQDKSLPLPDAPEGLDEYERDSVVEEGELIKYRRRHFLVRTLNSSEMSAVEDREEFIDIHYTPVIVPRPVDMVRQKIKFRCDRMGRALEIFTCVTIYNEPGKQLQMTLEAIAANLEYLSPGVKWEELAVALIIDGVDAMSDSMKDYLTYGLKVFDESIMRKTLRGDPVVAHIFEKSVELPRFKSNREYYQPLQIILCLKTHNGGKLNSHLWFFSGMCKQMDPRYTFMVDVGTMPSPHSFARLFDAMQLNPQLGGVCGEIAVRSPRWYNLLEASQEFEYKISHVLDKAMESVFGYIQVLPGAFSAYRWRAIRGEPLNRYFHVEENSLKELGPFQAQLFLAEDRVLAFELLAKKHRSWTLHFVSNARAETDAPDNLLELIKQRRRWLNGSFFALIYYITNFGRILREADHSFFRKIALLIQFSYMAINVLVNWFAIGSLYLSIYIIFKMAFDQLPSGGDDVLFFFTLIYSIFAFIQLLAGLGSQPDDMNRVYYVSSLGFGLMMIFAVAMSGWLLINGVFNAFILWASIGGFVAYATSGLLFCELHKLMMTFLQYMFMLPTFVTMFSTYSFTQLHNISWGTKKGGSNYMNLRKNIGFGRKKKDQGKNKRNSASYRVASAAGRRRPGSQESVPLNVVKGPVEDIRAPETKHTPKRGSVDSLGRIENGKEEEVPSSPRNLRQIHVRPAGTNPSLASDAGPIDEEAAERMAEQRAMEKEEEALKRREKRLEKEMQENVRTFAAFRTRMLALWMITNWIFVLTVPRYGPVDSYAFYIVFLVFFSLIFRFVGSILYRVEQILKGCWNRCCRCCCFLCCWERSRHGAAQRRERDRQKGDAGSDDGEWTVLSAEDRWVREEFSDSGDSDWISEWDESEDEFIEEVRFGMVDSDGNPVEFSDSEQFVDEAAQQGADSEPQIDLEDAMRKAEAMTQRVATRELLKEEASAESKEEEIDLDEAMRASEALTRAIEQREALAETVEDQEREIQQGLAASGVVVQNEDQIEIQREVEAAEALTRRIQERQELAETLEDYERERKNAGAKEGKEVPISNPNTKPPRKSDTLRSPTQPEAGGKGPSKRKSL